MKLFTMMEDDTCLNVSDLFQHRSMVKVCAPMVRYSKLQFRTLVRKYGCDLCYSPMTMADSFCRSHKARKVDFTTNLSDKPIIVQFASKDPHEFTQAAQLVAPYCSGVDLNCGCPQRWMCDMGLGCSLLQQPEQIRDIIMQCRNQIIKEGFSISVKVRLLDDVARSVDLCRQMERCGVTFLAVHARSVKNKSQPPDMQALRVISDSVSVPVIANGGVKTLNDAIEVQEITKCEGIMAANGLLTNPALFSPSITKEQVIQDWLDICFNSTMDWDEYTDRRAKMNTSDWWQSDTSRQKNTNLTFQCFHHHLVFMMEKYMSKADRIIFNDLKTFTEVLQFIDRQFGIRPKLLEPSVFSNICLQNIEYETDLCASQYEDASVELGQGDGKFFREKVAEVVCDISNLWL